MKLITKFLLLLISSTTVILNSCKENVVQPVDSRCMTDYEVQTLGSWWKYECYSLDSFGNREPDTMSTYRLRIDSIIYTEGRKGIIKTDIDDGSQYTYNKYYFYDCKLYRTIGIRVDTVSTLYWIPFADFNSHGDTVWNEHNQYNKIDYYHKIYISKGRQKEFILKGNKLTLEEFIFEEIIIEIDHSKSPEEKDELHMIEHTWYAKGIGVVNIFYNWYGFKNNNEDFKSNWEAVLVDYEIK
ncbi:MAG: hypothetical protein EPN82_07310 [Bacteroidetes bacterium]|nr:MAG: hypothetical protein EPN82_07310 [Bacteroidota bacterium]